jgi:trans-L-3-hydroxyproline dehydratase
MYGAVLTPSEDADFDVFFLHNEGYSTMCGHAIIALTKLVLETGLITKDSNPARLTINAPAGKIEASAAFEDGVVYSASFQNVPSFLYLRDEHIQIPGIGKVRFDIAYGGAFYAIVEAASVGIELIPKSAAALIELGRKIKRAITDYLPIKHPFEEDLSFLYGTIFTGPALVSGHHSRNVCIFADGELDRSATGTGISARVALHYAKRELRLHQSITIESVLGTMMTVKAIKQTRYGPYEAVIPEVSGTASITGKNEFFFDPEDSLRTGFILR